MPPAPEKSVLGRFEFWPVLYKYSRLLPHDVVQAWYSNEYCCVLELEQTAHIG